MTAQAAVEQGYSCAKEIPGKGIYAIYPMNFTVGLFVGIDETGYHGRYCYPNMEQAVIAITVWDGKGDPPGEWIKWKGYGGDRSRIPDKEHTSSI